MTVDTGDAIGECLHPVSTTELATLLKVSSELAGSLVLPVVLQTSIGSAVEVLGLDSGVIYMLEGEDLFLGAAVPPLPADMPEEHRHALVANHPHIAECLRELRPVVVTDVRNEVVAERERIIIESANLRSAIFVPLAVEDRPLGAFIVHSVGRVCEFGTAHIDLCRTLGHQISLAVANARLFETQQQAIRELETAYDATIKGWSIALDMRDHETGSHADRVTDMTARLAEMVGVPKDELVHVRRGALLHDIGKMVVPDSVLHKPGPLSEEEWVVMRRHPGYAREMLLGIDYLRPAIDIPYCHHERWDGTGYPRGLKDEEIPLSARVFAVVDVYDALVSDRPYRGAWSHEDALTHIRELAGKHFDSRVVDAFLNELVSVPGA